MILFRPPMYWIGAMDTMPAAIVKASRNVYNRYQPPELRHLG
jgi:hypothetical protein